MRSYSVKFVRKMCLVCISIILFLSLLTWKYNPRGSYQVHWKNNLKNVVQNEALNKFSQNEALQFMSDDSLMDRLSNCSSYFSSGQVPILSFDTGLMDHEEQIGLSEFPLAFSHLVHHQIGILEAFLALYFRPYNTHIIHIDTKASDTVKKSVSALAQCYQQKFDCDTCVFIPPDSVAVDWANSVLEAEMVNLNRLLDLDTPRWRFVISVAGSELPVMPYMEFVRKIQTLPEPGSAFDSFAFPEENLYRLTDAQKESSSVNADGTLEYLIEDSSLNVAMRIRLYKGSRYVVMSREKVEFVARHQVARAFYNWVQGMRNLEETFYATLLRVDVNQDTGLVKQNNTKTSRDTLQVRDGPPLVLWGGLCLRIVLWYPKEGQCHGQTIHSVCNFGLDDVGENLEQWDCIMANKFNLEVDARAVIKQIDYIMSKSKTGLLHTSE